jgi:hypothetical protein
MDTYNVTITGESPLLLHQDSIAWREQMDQWLANPENKKNSKAGDDRYPACRWIGCAYHDGKHLGIAADNLMTMLREGGAKVPTGKKGGSYKRQSQSGLTVNEILWPLETPVGLVPWPKVAALIDEPNFAAHEETARTLGFELFLKSARVSQSKHVRVRPRFNVWQANGSITVFDETITQGVLQQILDQAGMYCGLGDWRPSAPKAPGRWGLFKATVKLVKR